MSRSHLAVPLAGVALLLVATAGAFADPEPTTVDRERQRWLEDELKDAEQRVWSADQERRVALTGPGVNRINRNPRNQPPPPAAREQLAESALRRRDAAKTVVEEIRARLAGDVADLPAAHSLREDYESLPGNVRLTWAAVPGAAGYTVEVNVRRRGGEPSWELWEYVTGLERPEHTLEVGSAGARWRVWAVDSAGRGGPIGRWSRFPRDD